MVPPLLLVKFWKPLALVGVVMAVGGSLWYYGHTKYKEGYEKANAKYEQCHKEFKDESNKWAMEVANWNQQVAQYKEDLKKLEVAKEEAIQRNWDVFKAQQKKVDINKKATDNEIKATISPSDVVLVPRAFVSVYNHAVEGTRVTESDGGKSEVPDYSLRTKGQTVTFDAAYFAKVVKGNVDQYSSLALQCGKLIDIVIEQEKIYGNYLTGSNDKAGDVRGDVPSGTARN